MPIPQPPELRLSQNIVEAPHVIILGAGASVAACPSGDASGRRLPVMRNLVQIIGLESILENAGIKCEPEDNLEILYVLSSQILSWLLSASALSIRFTRTLPAFKSPNASLSTMS